MTDGRRVYSSCTLHDLDAPNIISVSPSIWLSLATSEDRAKKPSVSSGLGKAGNGPSQIPSILEFSGKGHGAVSGEGQ